MLVFSKRRKPEYQVNKTLKTGQKTKNLDSCTTAGEGIEPGSHWWKARALTIEPALFSNDLQSLGHFWFLIAWQSLLSHMLYIMYESVNHLSCWILCIYYMASSASGQYAANSVFCLATRAGKMERYYPPGTARFVPANKISPKFKRVHESFVSLKLLSVKVKRFFVIFFFMEPEKALTRMKTKKTKMLINFKNTFCSKNWQIKHKSLFWIWKFEFEM